MNDTKKLCGYFLVMLVNGFQQDFFFLHERSFVDKWPHHNDMLFFLNTTASIRGENLKLTCSLSLFHNVCV